MQDHEWAKAIIMHLTGRAEYPTAMLLKMVNDIRSEGYQAGLRREPLPDPVKSDEEDQ